MLTTTLFFTIALPIYAQVYTCEVNGKTTFTDQICEYEEQVVINSNKVSNQKSSEQLKYISFKYGGSACPEKKYWEAFIDKSETYDMKDFNKNCFYLREGNIVYSFLNRIFYKNRELVQVKSSDGKLLWLELAGVEEPVSSTNQKPMPWSTLLRTQNGKIIDIGGYSKHKIKKDIESVSKSITTGFKLKIKADEYKGIWPFPLDSGGTLFCKNIDSRRKAVWLNGIHSTYALNGQAMNWMKKNNFIGIDGGLTKIGREHSNNFKGLSKLISDGLTLCNENLNFKYESVDQYVAKALKRWGPKNISTNKKILKSLGIYSGPINSVIDLNYAQKVTSAYYRYLEKCKNGSVSGTNCSAYKYMLKAGSTNYRPPVSAIFYELSSRNLQAEAGKLKVGD